MRKPPVLAALALAAGIAVAGCGGYGEANDHKAPVPFHNVQLRWERIQTPPNYPSVVHSCFDGNGIYLNQDVSNTTTVVRDDPACKAQPSWFAG